MNECIKKYTKAWWPTRENLRSSTKYRMFDGEQVQMNTLYIILKSDWIYSI